MSSKNTTSNKSTKTKTKATSSIDIQSNNHMIREGGSTRYKAFLASHGLKLDETTFNHPTQTTNVDNRSNNRVVIDRGSKMYKDFLKSHGVKMHERANVQVGNAVRDMYRGADHRGSEMNVKK